MYGAPSLDDDDEFLYGSAPPPEPKHVPQPIHYEKTAPAANGVVATLESTVEEDNDIFSAQSAEGTPAPVNGDAQARAEEEEEEEEEEVDLGEESDEDVEIIMEAAPRSMDFRRTPAARTPSGPIPTQPRAAQTQSTLTTEYTPISRGGALETSQAQASTTSFAGLPSTQTQPQAQVAATEKELAVKDESGVDPATLPPVTAPPSHPAIDPTAVGVLDGRSILDVDLAAMVEKPWRRPGSDISDWFNYGFDEISWEAYCYRRRDLGELANVLKTNVLNFSGMPDDQLTQLPPEVRQMVMTGTTAMMNGAGNAGMMGGGVMMDMAGMMGPMGMGMGMGGDMGMSGAMMQMQDGAQMQQGGVGVNAGTPEQVGGNVGMMQDGFNGQAQGEMMNMGMGGEYGMQQQNAMGQQMYQGMEGPQQVSTPVPAGPGRGAAPVPYRGRGQGMMPRGRGFVGRGRGRGGFGVEGGPPPVPVRPASPLPPGVPTGPRNQNKYKDRDGNAPAVDGLDYGGTNKDMGRTPSGEPEDRSRKRRSSPGLDDRRDSKRR
ncbi:putative fip1 motif containing protein [Lyophyllum shimeji]|uniref:Fip1 motif containing protein n=1 Tax=Lyophyllum shimeji TaxID=47721 RepID=A0A9P3PYE7_LYOSH|nr:putative fip1 motif containing protein [Lyophyllum shimeji]